MADGDESFVWQVHAYTAESIRFADTKAGVVFTLSSALLGGVCAVHKGPWNFGQGVGVTSAFFWIGCTLLLTAIAVSAWSVRPRLGGTAKEGLVYWGDLLRHGNGEAYAVAVSRNASSAPDRTRQVAAHTYDLALICHAKYRWLSIGLALMLTGGLSGVLSIVLRPS